MKTVLKQPSAIHGFFEKLNLLHVLLLAVAVLAILPGADAFAHGMSASDKEAMLDGGYFRYIWLGTTHMLTGHDHLLFIFGVVFFLTTFKDIVKFISAFTLGHCITLIFATFMKITANYYLIDAVIAVSVMYKGFENINGFKKYFHWQPPNLLRMVFVFGLIHGFGLSTRLQQLPLGDDQMSMLIRILSFNVGVEVGQIVALTVMLIFLRGWRKAATFHKFAHAANVALIAGGIFLFNMQCHGFWHNADPDEFGFAEDNHAHHHMKLTSESKQEGQISYEDIR